MTSRRNDTAGGALSSGNDEGSASPTTAESSGAMSVENAPFAAVRGERSKSVTGETLTRGHRRADTPRARREPEGGEQTDPFDRWVDRQLRALYGPVADEPVPPRLRELIERASEGRDGGAGADDDQAGDPDGDGDADAGDDPGDERA